MNQEVALEKIIAMKLFFLRRFAKKLLGLAEYEMSDDAIVGVIVR